MSLDNFFALPASSKKRDGRKKTASKANANSTANVTVTAASQADNEHEEAEHETEQAATECEANLEDVNLQRDDILVERVTTNIAEMLDAKLAAVVKPVTELSGKLDGILERVTAIENRISDLEDVSTVNGPKIESLENALKKALERLDNYENQSRRQNIKITGLKAGFEGKDPVTFFEKWIPEVLDMQQDRVKIERAHRMGPALGGGEKSGPRAVLVRLHNYTDKQKILNAARNKNRLTVDGQEVSFYQDFSAEVIKKRQESASARRRLREAGIRYAFVYPAVIRIFQHDGTMKTLSNMKDVNNYIKGLTERLDTGK